MKPLRLLFLALAALLVVVAGGLAVLLDGRFQTWELRRSLARHSAGLSTVEFVSIGFNQSDLRGLHLVRNGAVLDVPNAQAEFPAMAAVVDGRYLVRTLVAKGWTLDLREAQSLSGLLGPRGDVDVASTFSLVSTARAAPARLPRAFHGIFSRLALPFDLTLAQVDLEGDILLPAAPGVSSSRIHATITGGGLGAGEDGRFVFRLSAGPDQRGPVSRVTADGALSAAMDSPRTFTRLAVRMNASAFGPDFTHGVRLVADASATRSDVGEGYTAVLSSETKPLLALLVDAPYDGRRPSGTWRLDVADEDLSPFLLGRELPHFDLAGQGQIDADPHGADVHLTGAFRADLDHLDALWPQLAPVGAVNVLTDFDLTSRPHLWRVDRLSAAVQGAEPIFTARSLQPFAFNPATGELQVANVTGDLFAIDLQALPLGWLRIIEPHWIFRGGPVRGSWVGSARAGGLNLHTSAPLTAAAVSAGPGDSRWVDGVDFSTSGAADYTPEGWQLELASATLRSAGGTIAQGDLKLGRRSGPGQPLAAEGTMRADLPLLLALPGLRASGLAKGTLSADISASFASARAIQAKLAFSDLATDSGALPNLTADVRADLAADGRLVLHAPLTLDRAGRRSSLALDGELGWGLTGPRFEGTVGGDELVVDDAQELLGAIGSVSGLSDAPTSVGGGARATLGWSAELRAAFTRVAWRNYAVSDVSGVLRAGPGDLVLDGLSARLDARGSLKGSLELSRASAENGGGCELKLTASADDIDPKEILGEPATGHAPVLEGRFHLAGQWTGHGDRAAAAFAAAEGDCAVESKGGHFRLLSMTFAPRSGGSNLAMDALRSVASTFGSVIGRHKNADFSNPAEAAVYAVKALSDIEYDQFSFHLLRDDQRNLICRDLALISPELRVQGGGTVTYQAGEDVRSWPLSTQFTLRARGKLGNALKYLDILDAKPDDLGYRPCPLPITIKGTLHEPDPSDMQAAFLKAVGAHAGDFLDKLLGK